MLRPMSASLYSREHVDVTADQLRHKITSTASVVNICRISDTVKSLTLKIHHPKFMFKAGQWVDFSVPGMDQVGGYSICSSVQQLKQDKTINLAIKESDYPTAAWIHKECKHGDNVTVRVGGNFIYDPQLDRPPHDLLLIAGGVGINPIVSIFQHAANLYENHPCGEWLPKRVHLLYSAKNVNELIFKKMIKDICIKNVHFKTTFFVTQEDCENISRDGVQARRIQRDDVLQVTECFTSLDRYAYICGPPQMLTDIESFLDEAHFTKSQIMYEKWW